MAPDGDQHDLLDIKQAAQFLQVSETSLRRWTNTGRLASLRVGRRRERRFRREDLMAFMEHHPRALVGTEAESGILGGERATTIGGTSVPLPTHLCGLYESEVGRVAQAANFLADGLRPGITCFLVQLPEVEDQILARLKRTSHRSLEQDIDAGRLVLYKYRSSPQAQLEDFERAFLAAIRGGAKVLRLVGDVTGGARKAGQPMEKTLEMEAGFERMVRRFPAVALCQYDARQHSGRDLLSIYRCHGDSFTLPAERLLAR
jgi:excisionase family DNA binding protein